MKNEKLTQDEYNALDEVKRGIKGERVSACVGRNTKRLTGIKLFTIAKNGRISLTDKGEEVLFLRRCILGLRAIEADSSSPLDADVAMFLGKKSHIVPRAEGGFELSDKGRESLADIANQGL
ncbi:hypothetical protein SAMN05428959_104165 [Duganella sp. CF517]|uniref:hypothetical protein n=1 Tax=Duganella sp. CF517 TaxID=1881038 RepID=UPI0008BCB502|nr:hypothetical protein [Duganella sp. CF517]SEO01015.1 hypothetical protein SAMN05428959_104165 [Duganella sp. CF517]